MKCICPNDCLLDWPAADRLDQPLLSQSRRLPRRFCADGPVRRTKIMIR